VSVAFSAAGASLESDTACYVLVQLPKDGGWVACLHVPPAAKVNSRTGSTSRVTCAMCCQPRAKMIYSSSFEALKRQLQIRVELSLQGSGPVRPSMLSSSATINRFKAATLSCICCHAASDCSPLSQLLICYLLLCCLLLIVLLRRLISHSKSTLRGSA